MVAQAWWDRLSIIAAYRDRWGVTAGGTLGDVADIGSFAQVAHRAWATKAAEEAARLGGLLPQMPAAGHSGPGVRAQVEL